MPYKRMGKSVYKKIGKTWRKTATASSVANAKKNVKSTTTKA